MDSSLSQSSAASLTLEISYPFHSHLIGRCGRTINSVMESTRTRVHFPDQNRIAGQKKSNQVVVRGQIHDVEVARQRIRNLIPVEFIVECNSDWIESLGRLFLVTQFGSMYGVLVRFYPKIDGLTYQVNIRGSLEQLDRLEEAVSHFSRLGKISSDAVMMKMETSFGHVWFLRDHINMIGQRSGAGVRCPEVCILPGVEQPKKYTVWLRGSIEAVFKASSMVNALLPVQLVFQAPANRFKDTEIVKLAEYFDLYAQIESSGATSDTIVFRASTFEKNVGNLYEFRRLCLSLPATCIVTPNIPAVWNQMLEAHHSFVRAARSLIKSTTTVEVEHVPVVSSAALNSAVAQNQMSVPSSLAGSRFDPNSSRQLTQLLEMIGLSRYVDLFYQNEVDLAMFTTLNDTDLQAMGISAFGTRKILLNAIQELRR